MKLYGKNPVIERLRSNPKSIKHIFIQEGFSEASLICAKAKQWSIPLSYIPRSKMLKMTHDLNAQGVLLEVEDYHYAMFDDLLETALKRNLTIVFLDGLNDPQNLGAIMRSLACLGGFAIVLPKHDSVEVTEAVLRVASGAENYIPVAKVSNISHAIEQAKKDGYWIAGTVVEGGQDLMQASLPFPLGLVIGSEQKGIRDVVKQHLDIKLTLPMKEAKLSFNAAQATTIFCYEITKQKGKKTKDN